MGLKDYQGIRTSVNQIKETPVECFNHPNFVKTAIVSLFEVVAMLVEDKIKKDDRYKLPFDNFVKGTICEEPPQTPERRI